MSEKTEIGYSQESLLLLAESLKTRQERDHAKLEQMEELLSETEQFWQGEAADLLRKKCRQLIAEMGSICDDTLVLYDQLGAAKRNYGKAEEDAGDEILRVVY